MIFGECFALPFCDKEFDISICQDVFMYLNKEEIIKSIQELIRVTSKYIIFSTIDRDSDNAKQDINPDDLRKKSVFLYSKKDYIDLFCAHGVKLFKDNIFPVKWDMAVIFKVL